MMIKTPLVLASLLLTLAGSSVARAQSDPFLESRVRQLESSVRSLEYSLRNVESNQRQLEYRVQRLENQPRPPAVAVCTLRTAVRAYFGAGQDVALALAAAHAECAKQEAPTECGAAQPTCS